jgi:two-component system alkaline phosphatase synthesis response regulator PhoP
MQLIEEIINKINESKTSVFTGEQVIKIIRNITKESSKRAIDEDNDIAVDLSSYHIEVGGEKKIAAKKVIQLAHYLLNNKARIVTRTQILADLWGDDVVVGIRTVDVHIRKLRLLIGEDCVTTIKSVGYQWKQPK